MPAARTLQLALPFETGAAGPVPEPVRVRQPAVEWRSFEEQGPVCQWIAFPPHASAIPNLTRHVRRHLLVEFRDAGIWFFRTDPRHAWPDSELAAAAATCRKFMGAPGLSLTALHHRLADAIDTCFEVLLPDLDAANLGDWNARAYVVDQIMAQAMPRSGQRGGRSPQRSLAVEAENLEASVIAELTRALNAFVDRLDPDLVNIASAKGRFACQAYNALVGPGAVSRRNRRQFAETFPVFADALLVGHHSHAYPVGLREAVDAGAPMIDFLARAFHAKRHTIRFLVGKTPADIGARWSRSPGSLISLLDSLPPDLRPTERRAWTLIEALVTTAEDRTLRPVSRALARVALRHWRCTSRESGIDGSAALSEFTGQLIQVTEFWAALEDCLRTRAETTHCNAQGVNRPQLRRQADAFVAERAWPTLVSLACDWRAAVVQAQAIVQPLRARLLGQHFAPLIPQVLHLGNRMVVPLTTPDELRREGIALHHCIEGYASACAHGESYIVSIRDPVTRHALSTAEFRITRDRPGPIQLRLSQHCGHANGVPTGDCSEAVRLLLASALLPAMQTHWAQLLAARQAPDGRAGAMAGRLAAILAHEHAFRQVLRPTGRYDSLLAQLEVESGPAVP